MSKLSWIAGSAMLASLTVQPAYAGYTILPPGSVIDGKSIADWTADWWTWGLQAPLATNPLSDTTGAFANVNNSGPVFFIAGNSATRNFTVPAGRPILLPLINIFDVEPVPPDPPSSSLGDRQAATDAVVNSWVSAVDKNSLYATIDGNDVTTPSSYLETTGYFDMGPTQAASLLESIGVPAGAQATPTKSAGYWLMITGLSLGAHELSFGGSSDEFEIPQNCCFNGTYPAFSTATTDTITVTPEPAAAGLMLFGIFGMVALRSIRQAHLRRPTPLV